MHVTSITLAKYGLLRVVGISPTLLTLAWHVQVVQENTTHVHVDDMPVNGCLQNLQPFGHQQHQRMDAFDYQKT